MDVDGLLTMRVRPESDYMVYASKTPAGVQPPSAARNTRGEFSPPLPSTSFTSLSFRSYPRINDVDSGCTTRRQFVSVPEHQQRWRAQAGVVWRYGRSDDHQQSTCHDALITTQGGCRRVLTPAVGPIQSSRPTPQG